MTRFDYDYANYYYFYIGLKEVTKEKRNRRRVGELDDDELDDISKNEENEAKKDKDEALDNPNTSTEGPPLMDYSKFDITVRLQLFEYQ